MKKLLFALPLMAILFFSSCTVEDEVDPNITAAIAGTYSLRTYEEKSDVNPSVKYTTHTGTAYKTTVTRVDDTHIDLDVTYTNNTLQPYSNLEVTESNGTHSFSKTYSGGQVVNGTVLNGLITVTITYTSGNYYKTTAQKD
jgi:hypothetical protein